MTRLAIVTATLDLERAEACLNSWRDQGTHDLTLYVIEQSPIYFPVPVLDAAWAHVRPGVWVFPSADVLGPVPAFALGVQRALEDGAEIIACLHDDLLIEHPGWDALVLGLFNQNPACGLLGFGGGTGLGRSDLYQTPYDPMQLARQDFVSNMRDAESHGRRSNRPVQVACLDGFSQIGRRQFWEGVYHAPAYQLVASHLGGPNAHARIVNCTNLLQLMADQGVVHHFYDSALGAYARRLGWEAWMLPIRCHHYGGRTAVGDSRYAEWANHELQTKGARSNHGDLESTSGDAWFWARAHQWGYDQFRDVLPFTVTD